MHAALPLVESAADVRVFVTDLSLPLSRVEDLVGAQIPIPQPDMGGFGRQTQALVRGAQFTLGAFVGGQVDAHPDETTLPVDEGQDAAEVIRRAPAALRHEVRLDFTPARAEHALDA